MAWAVSRRFSFGNVECGMSPNVVHVHTYVHVWCVCWVPQMVGWTVRHQHRIVIKYHCSWIIFGYADSNIGKNGKLWNESKWNEKILQKILKNPNNVGKLKVKWIVVCARNSCANRSSRDAATDLGWSQRNFWENVFSVWIVRLHAMWFCVSGCLDFEKNVELFEFHLIWCFCVCFVFWNW